MMPDNPLTPKPDLAGNVYVPSVTTDSTRPLTPTEIDAALEMCERLGWKADASNYPRALRELQSANEYISELREANVDLIARESQAAFALIDANAEVERLKADKEATMFKASVCDKWEGVVNERNALLAERDALQATLAAERATWEQKIRKAVADLLTGSTFGRHYRGTYRDGVAKSLAAIDRVAADGLGDAKKGSGKE